MADKGQNCGEKSPKLPKSTAGRPQPSDKIRQGVEKLNKSKDQR